MSGSVESRAQHSLVYASRDRFRVQLQGFRVQDASRLYFWICVSFHDMTVIGSFIIVAYLQYASRNASQQIPQTRLAPLLSPIKK